MTKMKGKMNDKIHFELSSRRNLLTDCARRNVMCLECMYISLLCCILAVRLIRGL